MIIFVKSAQNEKLKTIVQALIQREKEVESEHAMRIEGIKIKKTEQKNRLIAKLNKRKIKSKIIESNWVFKEFFISVESFGEREETRRRG